MLKIGVIIWAGSSPGEKAKRRKTKRKRKAKIKEQIKWPSFMPNYSAKVAAKLWVRLIFPIFTDKRVLSCIGRFERGHITFFLSLGLEGFLLKTLVIKIV